ncbi:MAG: hypothetical protein AAGA42_11280 [Actinomycetota bacterium]
MAGYNEFIDGDVLDGPDVMQFLMRQVRARFADASARNAALPTPEEGQEAYLLDVDHVTRYDGSAWKVIESPWTSFPPAWSNVTLGTSPTSSGEYRYVGGDLRVKALLVLGTGGALTGTAQLTLPNSETSRTGLRSKGVASFTDSSSPGADEEGVAIALSASTTIYFEQSGDVVDATDPFTWAAGDALFADITVAL